jgi:hypothetical protein
MKRILSIIAVFVLLVVMLPVATAPASAASPPQAICVPWQPTNPSIPHYTYSGKAITLKAIARGTCTQFRWDYGDGSPVMAWTNIANSYNLGVTHTYTGAVGQSFIATVYVRDGASGTPVSDTYPITIFDASDPSVSSNLDVKVNIAIDEGLWYLHNNLNRYSFAAGASGYGQPYGYWTEDRYGFTSAATGADINAFQMAGHRVNGDYDGNPYVEDVQRAMNYLLYYTNTVAIGPETGKSTPDINGNGFGLYTSQHGTSEQTYVAGICGVALASCGAPNYTAPVGSAQVYNRLMSEIVQDEVEFFAWGQADSGYYRGGWRYSADTGDADMSTTQWPVLTMQAARENMGSTIPDWVSPELDYFLNLCEVTATNTTNNGGYYYYPAYYLNLTKGGAGLICREFQGYTVADATVQRTLGFIYRHWGDTGGSWDWTRLFGNSYGMYAIMKAMRNPEPDITQVVEYNYSGSPPAQTANSFDWYYTPGSQAQTGMATYIVNTQQDDGQWDDTVGENYVINAFSTGWRILCLLKGVAIIPPEPIIYPCPVDGPATPIYTAVTYALNQSIKLTGSESYSPDPSKVIVSYEWDLDHDGVFDDGTGVTALIAGGFPLQGDYTVALRVTDNNPDALGGPQTGIGYYIIKVRPPDLNPVAVAGGPYLGFVGTALQLDGSASWDADGLNSNPFLNITLYEWDLDNDGVFDDATGAQPWYTWAAPYNGTIALKVTDDGWHSIGGPTAGWTGTNVAYTNVEIGHHDPVSVPGGPYTSKPNHTMTLYGSSSYSPDGLVITYAWDLNNDGTFGDSTAVNPTFTIGAAAIGTVYNIALKVTDTLGGYDIENTSITVVPNHPPVANAGPDQMVEQTSTAGATVYLSGSASSDADGDPLTYSWTWPGGGSSTLVNPAVLLPAGTTTLTLTAYDDDLASSTDTIEVTVKDTGKPTVFPPADISTEAAGLFTAVAIGTATATDLGDGVIPSSSITNDAPAAGFPLGDTTVTWTAIDSQGNIGTATQKVNVADTTPPVVTPPPDVNINVPETPAAVDIGTATATDVIGVVSYSNDAPALFPGGTTFVIWKAKDAAGNEGAAATAQSINVHEILQTGETNIHLPEADPGITDVWVTAVPVPGDTPPGFTPVEAYVVDSAGSGNFTLSFEVADPANVVVYKMDPNPPYHWLIVPITVVGNTVYINMTPGDPTFVFGSGTEIVTAPQVWSLDSESLPGSYQMEKNYGPGDDGQTGSVPIPPQGTIYWISDQQAADSVTFAEGIWSLQLSTDADWGTKGAACYIEIGYWDGSFHSLTPNPVLKSGSHAFTPPSGPAYYIVTKRLIQGGSITVPKGTYLAVQITNQLPVDPANNRTINTGEDNNNSCLRSPQTDPGYPLPELAGGLLLTLGLTGLGALIIVRRKSAKVKRA